VDLLLPNKEKRVRCKSVLANIIKVMPSGLLVEEDESIPPSYSSQWTTWDAGDSLYLPVSSNFGGRWKKFHLPGIVQSN